MTRIIDFILGVLTAAALSSSAQFEWRQFATGEGGETWHLRKGTVSRSKADDQDLLHGVVMRRDASGKEFVYRGITSAAHCGAKRGDIRIETLEGQTVAALVYVRGTSTVGALLATALCKSKTPEATQ